MANKRSGAGKKVAKPTKAASLTEEKKFTFITGAELTLSPSEGAVLKKAADGMPTGQVKTSLQLLCSGSDEAAAMSREMLVAVLEAIAARGKPFMKSLGPAEKKTMKALIPRLAELENLLQEDSDDSDGSDTEEETGDGEGTAHDETAVDEDEDDDEDDEEDEEDEDADDEDSFNEDTLHLVPTHQSEVTGWQQISRKVDIVSTNLAGRTDLGYGRRPSAIKDLDDSGKPVRGAQIGAPGFFRTVRNNDPKTADSKRYETVWFETCWGHKRQLATNLALRAHSQKVFDLSNGQKLDTQLKNIHLWMEEEFCSRDGPIATVISSMTSALEEARRLKKEAPKAKKRLLESAEDRFQAAVAAVEGKNKKKKL